MTYEHIIQNYDKLIRSLAQKIDQNDWEDHAQNMRLFILKYFNNYKEKLSPSDYYIKMMIFTSYRREIYDNPKQKQFENGFIRLIENIDIVQKESDYDYIIETIVSKIIKPKDKIVFYSIVYDTEGRNYKELAKFLNMNYMSFLSSLNKIKKIIVQLRKEGTVLI